MLLYLIAFAILIVAVAARQRRDRDETRQAQDDLTAHTRELERANRQLHAELAAAKEASVALQEAQARLAHVTRATMLGEITASIAHEVNQPLAAVVMNGNACVRWLSTDPPNIAEARAAALRIASDGSRAAHVIARVRALVKRAPAEASEVHINDLVAEALAFTRGEAAWRGVTLRSEVHENLPTIFADRIQLLQVLVNLILNGIDATSDVKDRERVLTVRSRQGDGKILVEVEDVGAGLEDGQSGRIFDAFYSTKPAALGIGLTVSRSIIEQHGGSISVTSNAGPGVTMRLSLPVAS